MQKAGFLTTRLISSPLESYHVIKGWVGYLHSSRSAGRSVQITSLGRGILELSLVGVTGDGRSGVSLVSESENPHMVPYVTLYALVLLTHCLLGNFSFFLCRLLFFFTINVFKKFFQEYHLGVKQFGP